MMTLKHREIVKCPSSWYLALSTAELGKGQIKTISIADQELVLFRDDAGKAHALRAHCIHMGCHLKHGAIIADQLRCPLHFRQFDGAGRCRAAPGGNADLAPAQPVYPLLEQFGGLFVFIGNLSAFSFPLPHDLAPEQHTTLVTKAFDFPLPWYSLIANGCDLDHLQTVHLRRLKEPPIVGPMPPHRFQVRYRTRIIGRSIADRAMRLLSGDDIRATITCFGGTLMLVESTIKSRRTFLLLSMRPQQTGTSVRCIVGQPSGSQPFLNWLSIRISTWLFLAFLRRDIGILEGQKLHRPTAMVTHGDRYVARLFDYFEGLDQSSDLMPQEARAG